MLTMVLIMSESSLKTIRTSVILAEDKHILINDLASANGVSTAWVIRYAINQLLDKVENNKELKLKIVRG